jgi:hypothetical protein
MGSLAGCVFTCSRQASSARGIDFRFTFQTATFQPAKIYKQKKPLHATQYQNMASRLAARSARVVEETNLPPLGLVRPLGVLTPRRGRAGCRVPDAPAALCAKKGSTSAHKYSQRRHRKTRQSRTRCVTTYTVLSSGRCSIAPVVLQKMVCRARLGRRTSAGLDPSIRGGTTRLRCPLQYRSSCATLSSAHRPN